MASKTTTVYVTRETDDDGDLITLVHESIEDAFATSESDPVIVEVYKLLRKVKVTRSESYHEEEVK